MLFVLVFDIMYTIFKNSVRVLVKYLRVVEIQLSVISLVYYQGKIIPKINIVALYENATLLSMALLINWESIDK